MTTSKRWSKSRKPRATETKPRKPRATETKTRKKRLTKFAPIAPPNDPLALASQRKTCSPALKSKRLKGFSKSDILLYSKASGISERHARKERCGNLHAGRPGLPDSVKKIVFEVWNDMVATLSGTQFGHAKCTRAELRSRLLNIHGISISERQASVLTKESGADKSPAPYRPHMNDPVIAMLVNNKRLREADV